MKRVKLLKNYKSEFSLICNKCKDVVWFSEFAKVVATCAKSKCWIKRPDALREVAQLSGKSTDDFIGITKGEITVHNDVEQSKYGQYGSFC